jgi:hypothetical protein
MVLWLSFFANEILSLPPEGYSRRRCFSADRAFR